MYGLLSFMSNIMTVVIGLIVVTKALQMTPFINKTFKIHLLLILFIV